MAKKHLRTPQEKERRRVATIRNKPLRAARHQKRLEKFKAKREAGEGYEYKPISFKKGSDEYNIEKAARKAKVHHREEYRWIRSNWDKMILRLRKEEEKRKSRLSKRKAS